MIPDWAVVFKGFIGLLALVNPIGAIPIFLALTEGRAGLNFTKIGRTTALTVAITLLVSAFLGQQILGFFGISVSAFQVGGGLLILSMGFSMVQAKTSQAKHQDEEAKEAQGKESLGVVPLGIPLLAGPGSITLVIVDAEKTQGKLAPTLIFVASILLVAACCFVALRLAPVIAKRVGKTGINIFTRVMGLLIMAIAIEYITQGLLNLLPGLNS